MCSVHMLAMILVIVGGLNWGLVGVFEFDLVSYLFGTWPIVPRIIYIAVGVAALLWLLPAKMCKMCSKG